ncbi:MAG: PilZ domain-containing protein [Deltaproteobacteria bacterium]|nr:PilZ domain-containing protein [Deltaproteobacteria bacterium]
MENRRDFVRFFSELKARYLIKDDTRGWKECTITNASLKGMGINFPTYEDIYMGSILFLVISVPTELVPVNVRGKLQWTKKKAPHLVGGIEYPELLDDKKFSKLGLF